MEVYFNIVYRSKSSFGLFIIFCITKEDLLRFVDGYENGKTTFFVDGEEHYTNSLYQIQIYDTSKVTSTNDREQIKKAFQNISGDKSNEIIIKKNFLEFGIEVTNQYIQDSWGSKKQIKVVIKGHDWSIIHDDISKIAKTRFETGHFADAVESAFKELNDIIKKKYKEITGIEEDGDKLMRRAFSVNNPTFRFNSNTTESEKSIQQGYMDIFAGCMKGIRNPKAHANLNIPKDEAWEMIVLASHLMRMWDKTQHFS